MAEELEIIRQPVEGLVAGIISERELAINIGSEDGVVRGMKFRVVAGSPTEITDPETGEVLGTFTKTKVRVMADQVSDNFSICRTYRTHFAGSRALAGMWNFLEPGRRVPETLRAEDSDYIPELSEEESFVKKGDKVKEILAGNMTTIQDVEKILNGAVLRGVLDKARVEKAVNRWKKADLELEEAREETDNREEKIDAALEEFNNATSELTELYNRVVSSEEDE